VQFSVRVAGRMSADAVARHTARALDITGPAPRFISNERWEIEVVPCHDSLDSLEAEPDPGAEGCTRWELRCRAVGEEEEEEEAAADLERVMHALLAGGAWEVVIGMPRP
jgi:hypothetical protein